MIQFKVTKGGCRQASMHDFIIILIKMGREYKHSVKGSLTRKLVLIIISSVVILYGIVIVVQTFSSKAQSDITSSDLIELQTSSFKGQLQSRSGQIGQKLQMYINDLQNYNLNLGLLYDGSIVQSQSPTEERSYYFNSIEY